MYVRSISGEMPFPEPEVMGRRRRRRRRRPRKLFRKIAARLKKRGLLRKLKRKLQSRRGRKLRKAGAMAVFGPFGKLAKRMKKRFRGRRRKLRALRKKFKGLPRKQRRKMVRRMLKKVRRRSLKRAGFAAAGPFGLIARRIARRRKRRKLARRVRARGAAAIVPSTATPRMLRKIRRSAMPRMLRKARRPFDSAPPEERAMMAPEEVEAPVYAPVVETPEEAFRVGPREVSPAEAAMVPDDMPEEETGGGIMDMIKRNPLLIAIPGGVLLLLMVMPKGGKRAKVSTRITQ